MASDSEKLTLIRDVRDGKLPDPPIMPVTPQTAEASYNVTEKMDFQYNPDGTLAVIVQEGKRLEFVWDSQQRLSRVVIRESMRR